jgi:hypothetical protein
VPICYLSPLPYAYDVHNLVQPQVDSVISIMKEFDSVQGGKVFQVEFMLDIDGLCQAPAAPRAHTGTLSKRTEK